MGIQKNRNFCTLIVNDMCTKNGMVDTQCQRENFEKCVGWKKDTNLEEYNEMLKDTLKKLVTDSIENHSIAHTPAAHTPAVHTPTEHAPTEHVSTEHANTAELPKIVVHGATPSPARVLMVTSDKMRMVDDNYHVKTHEGPHGMHNVDIHTNNSQIHVPNLKEKILPVVIEKPEQPFPSTKVQGVSISGSTLQMPDIEIEKLCMDYLNTK